MTVKNHSTKVRILFLFANRPLSLQVNMIRLLESTGLYDVPLVYMNRIGSSVSMPKSGFLHSDQWYEVTWKRWKTISQQDYQPYNYDDTFRLQNSANKARYHTCMESRNANCCTNSEVVLEECSHHFYASRYD